MQAAPPSLTWQRDVELLLSERAIEPARSSASAVGDGGFDPLARRVEGHPAFTVAHLAQRLLQLVLRPRYRTERRRLVRGGRAGHGAQRLADERVTQEGPGRVVGPAALASVWSPDSSRGRVNGESRLSPPEHDNGECAVDTYAPFAEIYEAWSAPMTEDIPFYVGLAR